MKIFLFLLPLLILCTPPASAQRQVSSLEQQISRYLEGKKALVGVAVLTDKNELAVLHNDSVHFPLLSVFKYHVALAVLHKMDKRNIALDSLVLVKASRLLPDTYSPLKKKHPVGDVQISLRDLLKYSISLSDNNACDILIGFAGGIGEVHNYIKHLGISDFNLSETEETMHLCREHARRNWSTPSAMVRLLKLVDEEALFGPEYKDFLWQTMVETSTGTNKIKGLLPAEVVVGHKTGSSDRNRQGMKMADNDAGVVLLPDGRKYYIAVFVADSYETDEANADIIAQISRMVYEAVEIGL